MTTMTSCWEPFTVEGYPVAFEPTTRDGEPWWMATLPDLRGCMSDGATQADALENLKDAAALYIETAVDERVRLPHPYSSFARTVGTS